MKPYLRSHASKHLWALARTLFGEEGEAARAWVAPLLSGLKHGGGAGLLSLLSGLAQSPEAFWSAGQREVPRREEAYFRSHAERLDYPGAKRKGMPLGSGSMESACGQLRAVSSVRGSFGDVRENRIFRRWNWLGAMATGPTFGLGPRN